MQATDIYWFEYIFVSLGKCPVWKFSQFWMSPQTSILCQKTPFHNLKALFDVLYVIFINGLHYWNIEIPLLQTAFTL